MAKIGSWARSLLTELGKEFKNIVNPKEPIRIPVGHPPIEDIRSEPIRAKRPLESESRVQFRSLDRLPPPQDTEQELQGAHSVHSSEVGNRTKSRLSFSTWTVQVALLSIEVVSPTRLAVEGGRSARSSSTSRRVLARSQAHAPLAPLEPLTVN